MSTTNGLFADKSPVVHDIYAKIEASLKAIGPYETEVKKTSLHLVNRAAFGGVHPKKSWLDFNLVMDHEIEHGKITKIEQVSKKRFHCNFRFHTVEDVDSAFIALLKQSYELMG